VLKHRRDADTTRAEWSARIMLPTTVTHYYPWTESDGVATCGHRMSATDVHSLQPTCLTCTVALAADEARELELDALPLDADEARTELDPILNAGLPARPMSPLGAEVFALAQRLNFLALRRLLDEAVAS
jgi:hypothetical protein